MADQHKYTSAVTVTENVARVKTITIFPTEATPYVEVVYHIGEETGGVFTRTDTKVLRVNIADLPGATQTTLADLEDKALTAGENAGVYPAGSNETIP